MARAEIISVGTELLLGEILDTNAQFISHKLTELGIDCLFRSTVGDNQERIISTFHQALNRTQIIISTGGLGPTADDLTHESIAKLFDTEMIFDQIIMDKIKYFFEERGIVMVESNRKQAYRPRGSDILENKRGTAPGIIWTLDSATLSKANIDSPHLTRYILTFPGVPSEMKEMWEETAHSFLFSISEAAVLWSCELKHYGIGESTLAEKYSHLLNMSNPTVAPYAGSGECRLRVSAKAASITRAKELAKPIIEEIKNGSKHLCYGFDKDTLESILAKELIEKKYTISVAESCTGGLVSKRLTDIPGSSEYTKLNVVTYANEAKQNILSVSNEILQKEGAVSAACALAMAEGVRNLAKSDIGLSITGIAGPGGASIDKPIGLVYFGLANKDSTLVIKRKFSDKLTRTDIRFRSASEALNMLRLWLIDPNLLN